MEKTERDREIDGFVYSGIFIHHIGDEAMD